MCILRQHTIVQVRQSESKVVRTFRYYFFLMIPWSNTKIIHFLVFFYLLFFFDFFWNNSVVIIFLSFDEVGVIVLQDLITKLGYPTILSLIWIIGFCSDALSNHFFFTKTFLYQLEKIYTGTTLLNPTLFMLFSF